MEPFRPNGHDDTGSSHAAVLEPRSLATRILTRWPVAIVELVGDLSVWEVSGLQHEIRRIIAANPKVVVVDLGRTGMISSLGLGMITTLHRNIARHGGVVRLARPTEHVRTVIERARLDAIFEIHDTVESAMVL